MNKHVKEGEDSNQVSIINNYFNQMLLLHYKLQLIV